MILDLTPYQWEKDPVSLAKRDDVDIFIELIGGHDGVAKEAVEVAIRQGKDVVTANKALLAHHGHQLALKAEENGSILRLPFTLNNNDNIFRGVRGGSLNPRSIQLVMKLIREKLGIASNATPHSLRHSLPNFQGLELPKQE